RRTGTIPKLGASNELRADAFTLTSETPLAPRVYATSGDAVVVALKARTPADMKDLDAARSGIQEALLTQRREAALAARMGQRKERAARDGALHVPGDANDRG